VACSDGTLVWDTYLGSLQDLDYMLSRSALWVYFPLQELLASDADIGVVRMRRVSIHIHYHSTTMAAHVLRIYPRRDDIP